jgi:CheY-like chemotaxis protein
MTNAPSKSILYIENEQAMALLVKSILEGIGYVVEIAPDGENGLQKIRQHYYDIILLEVVIPKIDGITLLEIIADEKVKHGNIVIFT